MSFDGNMNATCGERAQEKINSWRCNICSDGNNGGSGGGGCSGIDNAEMIMEIKAIVIIQ
jgi:hypothetical protein